MFNIDSIKECLKIDLNDKKIATKLELKQYSKGSQHYHIQLVKKNIPVNIEGYSVSIFYKKSNGKSMIHPVDIINPKFGICQCIITDDLVSDYGTIEAELYFKKGDNIILSPTFSIKVNKSVIQKKIDKPDTDLQIYKQEINAVKEEVSELKNNTLKTDKQLDKADIDRILSIFDI